MLVDTTCCGLDEIEGLDSPVNTLLEICYEKYGDGPYGAKQAFIMFTDAIKFRRGEKLAKYISENELGELTSTPKARRNPNSNNRIKVWIWAPNEKKLKAWWKKNRRERDDDYY